MAIPWRFYMGVITTYDRPGIILLEKDVASPPEKAPSPGSAATGYTGNIALSCNQGVLQAVFETCPFVSSG